MVFFSLHLSVACKIKDVLLYVKHSGGLYSAYRKRQE